MIQSYLQQIERIARDTVPVDQWHKLIVTALMVETFIEFDAFYLLSEQAEPVSFDIYDLDYVNTDIDANDVTEFLQKIRTDLYQSNPDRGAFYAVRIEIGHGSTPVLQVDYDLKPSFQANVPDEWFVKDLKLFPRAHKYTPEWLSEMR